METSTKSRADHSRTEPSRSEPSVSQPEVNAQAQTSEMATVAQSATVAADIFAGAAPKEVTSERQVSSTVNLSYWAKFYTLARIAASSEDVKRKARCAVYTYCAINGTSRAGEYSSNVVSADGTSFNSSFIAKACNLRDVRKWMRTNADEAVLFFRATGVLAKEPMLVQRTTDLGFSVEAIIGVVDFVSDSPLLSVIESRLTAKSFENSIQKARAARDGKSLESVEMEAQERNLEAQNGAVERGNVIHMG